MYKICVLILCLLMAVRCMRYQQQRRHELDEFNYNNQNYDSNNRHNQQHQQQQQHTAGSSANRNYEEVNYDYNNNNNNQRRKQYEPEERTRSNGRHNSQNNYEESYKNWAEQMEREVTGTVHQAGQLGHRQPQPESHQPQSRNYGGYDYNGRSSTSRHHGYTEQTQTNTHQYPALANHNPFSGFEDHYNPYGSRDYSSSVQPSFPSSFGQNNPFSFLFGQTSKRWWEGSNVCMERKEIDETSQSQNTSSRGYSIPMMSSKCLESETDYTCTNRLNFHGIYKTFIVSYRCCHGYVRSQNQQTGGCEESNIKNLKATLKDLGGERFANLLSTFRLDEMINSRNLTIFCPSESALQDYEDKYNDNDIQQEGVPTARHNYYDQSTLTNHMVPDFVNIADFIDEKVLYSESEGSTLRTNTYDNFHETTRTINCARITSQNNFALNGIVHMVDRVLVPVTKSIGDMITGDSQFSILRHILSRSDMLNVLRQPGQLTMFAPTDDAFRKIDPSLRERLQRGEACASNILKNHILPNVICSAAVQGTALTRNMLDAHLTLDRKGDDKLFVNDQAQVTARDMMGTNGVVHVVDAVIIPDDAQTIPAALEDRNLTDFSEYLEFVDLLNGMETKTNVTIFAPTNEAFQNFPNDKLDELRRTPDKMKDLLQYHVVDSKMALCDFENNLKINTNNNKDIRINIYTAYPYMTNSITAQCARIVQLDQKACGSNIQVIDQVLVPPEGKIPYVLAANGSFGILRRLLRDSGYEEKLMGNDPYTLIAPTDKTFYALPEEYLRKLLGDKNMAAAVVANHVIPGVICCAGVNSNPWYYRHTYHTANGGLIEVYRSGGEVHFGTTRVTDCDKMADNGVIHTVNNVILPPEQRSRPKAVTTYNTDYWLMMPFYTKK